MPKYVFPKGSTSKILEVFIQDASSSVGAGMSGLVFNTAGLNISYHRNTSSSTVKLIPQTMTLGTFAPSGFIEVDRANMQGVYQFCLPDAAYATGADFVVGYLKCSGVAPVPLEIQLTDAAIGYVALSGIANTSYTLQPELSAVPSFPISPVDMMTWIFEQSFNQKKTTVLADYIYKANGTTVLASGQVSDDGNQLIRQKYQ